MTREWTEVNDFSSGKYCDNKNIKSKTCILRSDLCDDSNAYIAKKGR